MVDPALRHNESSRLVRALFARPYVFALLLASVGIVQMVGGFQLVLLHGSPYYLVAGGVTLAAAVLAAIGRREALLCYGSLLLGTIIWSLWEVGFDPWALAPRLAVPVVFELWLLAPWTRRRLHGARPSRFYRAATYGLSLLGAVILGGALYAGFGETRLDPLYQAGVERTAPAAQADGPNPLDRDWPSWGRDAAGTRFSPLAQIRPDNVGKLRLAWTYRFGPAPTGAPNSLEVTPLKIDDSLYLCNDYNDVVALDAETGHERWRFHANTDVTGAAYGHCRGVAYARVATGDGPCAKRIYTATIDARLIAVDANDGRACAGFGSSGIVSLQKGMSPAPKGYYFVTSAPTLIAGHIVVGGWVSDGMFWGEPSGVVRAFDLITGQLDWAFDVGHPDRHGLPPEGEYYTPGTPNAWAPMSADEALGLVYVPLGGASLDYSGAQRRPFDEQWSGVVAALDAQTGVPRWKFQTVHHDLWDYDVPAQPTLIDLPTPNGTRKALLQTTKRGEVFLLDRATGEPIAPVTEHAVPTAGTAPGERAVPTQPFSDTFPSFRGPPVTEKSMWGLTPLDQLWCRIRFREARYEGPLTPPGLSPNIAFPGFLGGTDWGGVSIDLDRHLMIVISNLVANYTQLLTRQAADAAGVHPLGMGGELKPEGVGIMAQAGTPYAAKALPFLSLIYAPCQAPPWGRLSAVDLVTRKVLWSQPIGTARDSGPLGIPSMLPFRIGTPNIGGSVTTRGGLIFIGATQDQYLRAVDIQTGEVLWRSRLPAGAQATPMTYFSEPSGRQFVTIAAGGHAFLGTRHGDYIMAFALPK